MPFFVPSSCVLIFILMGLGPPVMNILNVIRKHYDTIMSEPCKTYLIKNLEFPSYVLTFPDAVYRDISYSCYFVTHVSMYSMEFEMLLPIYLA